MSKLYAMNICLYILLLHFVANKEKLFMRIKGSEKKIEFSLDLNTKGGISLYNILKQKPLEYNMERQSNKFQGKDQIQNIGNDYQPRFLEKGQLGFQPNELIIVTESDEVMSNKIGEFTNLEEFDSFVSETATGTIYTFEFLLVEEKDEPHETPKKRKKSENWKTVKILKSFIALKRYRIMKRMKRLKLLKS